LRRKLPSRSVNGSSFIAKGDDAWFFADASVVFHREAALSAGGYDSEFKMGDQPLWFRLLRIGKGFEMGNPLYVYRSSPVSMNFGVYHNDVAAARCKYFGASAETKDFDWTKRNNKFWYKVAIQELIAGNGNYVRKATRQILGQEHRKRRLKLRCASCAAKLFAAYYRLTAKSVFVHLPDLERSLLKKTA